MALQSISQAVHAVDRIRQPWPIANARGAFLASSGGRSEWMEHLACFWPGTLALSVLTNVSANPKDDTAMAINLTAAAAPAAAAATSCYHASEPTRRLV